MGGRSGEMGGAGTTRTIAVCSGGGDGRRKGCHIAVVGGASKDPVKSVAIPPCSFRVTTTVSSRETAK